MSENASSSTEGNGNGNGSRKKAPNVRRSNYTLVGTVVVSILVIGLALGMTKPEWQQYFNFGFTTREINFSGDYFVLPNASKVKVAGVEVGRIDSVQQRDDGTATYTVRVQPDVIDKVGTAPSANVRPVTLLGGIVYVDLLPGGDRTRPWEDSIPIERSKLPVELSPVINAIQPDAVKGIPASINGLEGALSNGATQGLKDLAKQAPGALGPGAGVINSLTGQNPAKDLPAFVDGFQRATAVLSRQDGQIESILRDLKTTTGVFRETSKPVQDSLRIFPSALDTATPALAKLSVTLDKLKATAPAARPAVQELDPLLARLDPFLVRARPVVNNLRYALQETRPLVQSLVPAAKDLRYTFKELDPSLDRVRGPVVDMLESPYNPVDDQPVAGGGFNPGPVGDPVVSTTKFDATHKGRRHTGVSESNVPQGQKTRQELGPLLRGLNGTVGYYDSAASAIAFNVGFGPDSVSGIGLTEVFNSFLGRLINPNALAASAGPNPLRLPVPSLPGLTPSAPLNLPVTGRAPAPAPAPAAPAAPAAPLTGGLLTGGNR